MAKLTKARRAGLAVLASRTKDRCFRSNVTTPAVGYVYWQTADWLIDNGYVEYVPPGRYVIRLTAAGLDLARAEGLL